MIITIRRPVNIAIAAMTYNQPQFITALRKELDPFLKVIDNGSNPPIPDAHIVVPENRYFSGGWNYAMQFIDADWVAMLNDDILGITRKMVTDLIELAEYSNYDVISPAFNSPHPHMQPQSKGLHQVHSIDWVAAIIRKSAWDDVGGFNEVAFPGWGAELDLAYRLKKRGHRMAVDDRYNIYHLGGVAAWEAGTGNIQNNVEKMNASFQKLYGEPDWASFVQKYLL